MVYLKSYYNIHDLFLKGQRFLFFLRGWGGGGEGEGERESGIGGIERRNFISVF